MTYILGDLGRSWSFFRDLGSKDKILLGSRGNYFQGSGEINALFSGIKGAQTPPPWGPRESSPEKTDFDCMRKAKVQISLHICTKWFAAILLVSLTTFQIEFQSRPVCALYVSKPFNFLPWVAKNRSHHTSASGNRRVSVVIFMKV